MKINIFLMILIFAISCNQKPKVQEPVKTEEQEWQIQTLLKEENTYNKMGLLDTTYQSQGIYYDGLTVDVMKSIIVREYDSKNNLVHKKVFSIPVQAGRLTDETIYKYDENNNLTFEKKKSGNVVDQLIINVYNNKNQKIEETDIQRKLAETPTDMNFDSVMVQTRKSKPSYDTSIITYQYDTTGNMVNKINKNSNHEIIATNVITYADNKKKVSYGINNMGDTLSVTSYLQSEDLKTEIIRNKNNRIYIVVERYDGNKLIEKVFNSQKGEINRKETYKYDSKGNEIENISYKQPPASRSH